MTGSTEHSTDARKVADVQAMLVDLKINENTSLLFILLGADGSINRSGSGSLRNKNNDLFIGKATPAIFERVRSQLTEEVLQNLGMSFRREIVRGAPCSVKLIVQFKDGTSKASEYLYGTESVGPPTDVVGVVTAAVRETEEWYQQQLRMAQAADEHRH